MPPRKNITTDCHFISDKVPLHFDGAVNSAEGFDPQYDHYPPIEARSVDIGPKNFLMGLMRLECVENSSGLDYSFVVPAVSGIDLRNGDPNAGIEMININMRKKVMYSPDTEWFSDPTIDKTFVLTEKQVDQVLQRGSQGKGRGPQAYLATNYAIYSAFQQITMEIDTERDLKSLDEKDSFTFLPRTGHQKYGLKGLHGNDRKTKTGDIAIELLEQDTRNQPLIDWMRNLKKPKPFEDVGDIILQAARYLEEQHKERLKKKRMYTREQAAKKRKQKRVSGPPKKRTKYQTKK